jgi:hypothetical protein
MTPEQHLREFADQLRVYRFKGAEHLLEFVDEMRKDALRRANAIAPQRDVYKAAVDALNRITERDMAEAGQRGRRRRETRTTTEDRAGRSIPVVRKARPGFGL